MLLVHRLSFLKVAGNVLDLIGSSFLFTVIPSVLWDTALIGFLDWELLAFGKIGIISSNLTSLKFVIYRFVTIEAFKELGVLWTIDLRPVVSFQVL